jgi:hypothetical protein
MKFRRSSLLATAAILLATTALARGQTTDSSPSAPTPAADVATLMHQVLENQNQIDKLRENYACRDTREVEALDKHGHVQKTTKSVYQISFFGGHQIQRLIRINGEPLDPKAQKKEDERIRKAIGKYEREQNSGKQIEQRKKAELTIQDFLKADRFSHRRRETIDGRQVIAFDFEANPAFKAKTRVEKVAQSLAGTIWIDAEAHEVVRLEARFAKSFKVGWGLVASVHRGTAVAFEQTLVHNQIWLPTYAESHVSVRALFFHLRQNQTDRYSDYRQFHVQSSSTPFPPRRP